MTSARCAATALLVACSFGSGNALAQTTPPAAQRRALYSRYENETIAEVLRERNLLVDAHPEGKVVERVDIVALPPFEKRDVVPQWLNTFHVTTQDSVVRSEVLLHEGGLYEQALVDDTIRNLRRLPGVPQLSTVIVVTAQGSTPDHVIVVVVTKDVWSLRLNWNVVADAGGLDQLVLEPSEDNFLGTHQIVGTTFVLEPSAYTVGLGYTVPRLWDSRIAMQTSANMMINRLTGSPEGTYGQVVAGEPLYSGKTDWAWDSTLAWQDVILRRYSNAQLSAYVDPSTGERLPFEYRARTFMANYEITRSYGWDTNHDFTLAATINRAVYQVNPPAGVDAQTVADFTSQAVPVSDTRVGPSLQYHSYKMRFVRVVDFDTLALQEDYRLGHDVVLRVYPSFRALGATRDVVAMNANAQYTWAIRDGLFRLLISSDTEPQLSGHQTISDAFVQPAAHLVTPTIAGLGRIVVDGSFLYRWRNYLNQTAFIGGDDRIRGFPTNYFVGANVLAYNVEARSRPVEILSCQVSGVGFFDIGDAYGPTSQFRPYQALGVGIRALFPWLDRTVFRADIGFPIERPIDPATSAPIPPYEFLFTFGQAFGTPSVAPAPVLPTGQGPDAP